VNESLAPFARTDVIDGPTLGPRSREMPFALAIGVRSDRVNIG